VSKHVTLAKRLIRALAAAALMLGAMVNASVAEEPEWKLVTRQAPWQARDSQGELVYRDQLWILGGWFDSFKPAPRDVWSSTDGENWKQVTAEAPWRHSDLPMSLVFADRMWMMGGWSGGRMLGHEAGHEIWSSTDGKNWQQATAAAPWSARLAAATCVFNGRMWILGGTENYYFGDESSLKNDVWSSADGKNWRLEQANAPWAPRAYHQAVVMSGRMYILGGGNYVPTYKAYNDVWSSRDGVNWELVTDNAPWHPRLWFSSVVYRDRMWVIGGWSGEPSKNWGDVWHSGDGKQWHELVAKNSWKERHEHSAFVWQDKLWVAGGHAQPLSSEVWSIDISDDWFKTPAAKAAETPDGAGP